MTDHSILSDCLKHWLGVDGTVLMWMKDLIGDGFTKGSMLHTICNLMIHLSIGSRIFDSSIVQLPECLIAV